jgi:UDP-N-acetyl-D-mannosaminuronate dehydrogenase
LLEKNIIEKEFGIKSYDFSEKTNFDAVILAVPHKQFREIGLKKLKEIMAKPILIDIKNFYKKEDAIREGIIYRSL